MLPNCMTSDRAQTRRARLGDRLRGLAREEDGTMIVFGVMMLGLMLAMGGLSFDLMRYEMHRDRLQSTLDRAVLAAAALNQTRDAEDVIMDYFTAAGLEDMISRDDIDVSTGFGSKTVSATAAINVPLHHGIFAVFSGEDTTSNTLVAEAKSTAEEGIGNVEISLVLDVSGSMALGSGVYSDGSERSRLDVTQEAAGDFIDTIYGNSSGGVTTSIIPYSTQVNGGAEFFSYVSRTDSHEDSHCLNFSSSTIETDDYDNTAIELGATSYQQTMHFDPYTPNYVGTSDFDIGRSLNAESHWAYSFEPACPTNTARGIMYWQDNTTTIKNYINSLYAKGATSTDIGAKWGAALLDPSTQTAATGMVAIGAASNTASGRPVPYTSGEAMKVLVIMTDGDNTTNVYLDDYRSGDSYIWKYQTGDDVFYSIWQEGSASEPVTELTTTTNTYTVYWTESEYSHSEERFYDACVRWSWWFCAEYEERSYWVDIYVDVEYSEEITEEILDEDNWKIVYNTNFDDPYSYEQYADWNTPYDGEDESVFDGDATRMTWNEVWAEIPIMYWADTVLPNLTEITWTERQTFVDAVESNGQTVKDENLLAVCDVANLNGITVFTIGVSVSDHSDAILESCASSTSHYYDVENMDISGAFQAIATQINQLRLVQ